MECRLFLCRIAGIYNADRRDENIIMSHIININEYLVSGWYDIKKAKMRKSDIFVNFNI